MTEKTEQPTPKKLRDARKKGQVPSSKEVVSALLLTSFFAFIWLMSTYILTELRQMILLPAKYYESEFELAMDEVISGAAFTGLSIVIPLLGVVIVVAFAGYFIQFGMLFAGEALKPDLKKLNPMQGLKKIFGIKNLVEFIKSMIKIVFLSILLILVIRNSFQDLLQIPHCGVICIPEILGKLLFHVALNTIAAFIVIAAADLVFQRWQFMKEQKMSKDEVKREYKEMEGDPMIKGKRKQLHQELMQQNMMDNVKRAKVVVTNPTRIAIALDYREGETPLPVVCAKGENFLAQRIIEVAREEGIPVMENVPLARSLHEQTSLNQYIPVDLIEPVAEVLRFVANMEDEQAT